MIPYRPRLHRGQAPDEYFAQALTGYWQEAYPHYCQTMAERASDPNFYQGLDGQTKTAVEDHLHRIGATWYAPQLAWEVLKAEQRWWPWRNFWWMWSQLVHGRREIEPLAREHRAPAWLLRAYAIKHGIKPRKGAWGTLRWVFRGDHYPLKEAATASSGSRVAGAFEEQCSFEDDIFLRRRGGKLYLPAEAAIRGEL